MKQRGITLFHLLASAAFFSIVLSFGFPLLYSYMQMTRLYDSSQTMTSALISARTEAVKKARPVILCSSIDGLRCSDSGEWEQGFLYFVDNDLNGRMSGDEKVVKYFPPLLNGATIRSSFADSYQVVYLPSGAVKSIDNFNICITESTGKGRTINVNLTGRPDHKPGANQCPGMLSANQNQIVAQR